MMALIFMRQVLSTCSASGQLCCCVKTRQGATRVSSAIGNLGSPQFGPVFTVLVNCRLSGDQGVKDMPMHIRQPSINAVIPHRQLRVVDPEQVQDRCMNIV